MSFPAPESLTPAKFQGILEYLRILLQNLPTALPVGSAFTSKYLAFLTFMIDTELLDRTGSEIGALNEQFKQIFGWQTRTTGSGIVAIEERGEPICTVVDVLEDFHVRYPTDNVIKKWAVDIGIEVQEVYSQHNIELPPQGTATKQQKQTLLDSVLSTSNTAVNNPQTVFESSTSSRGCPVHALMQKLIIKTTIMSKDSKPKVSWKCILCDHSQKGSPQESCVLKHSATCKKLPVHLQNEAITALKDTSLGAQLIELDDQCNMAPSVEIQPHMDEPPAKNGLKTRWL
ncbi:uncharacterized protein HD556DRAFT_1438734 [Suillus plorans]|uniref:Uncharacterized protein n=1 Tax=Suillus plorans TaxID=116603 RepID=A0A9P7DQK2_9AGAM|nr:uncharacterized protein HD556DRAFT_1438734 [Suillus plorans]KAG1800735.1 hypothetical protein HD556DRAFT_1438734 [Suillus plorans]